MKESVRWLVERLRGRVAVTRNGSESDPVSLPFVTDGREFKSGLTTFDDRALRFRSLTTSDAASTGLEEPSVEHAAFKIRIANREGFQQAASTLIERRYTERGYQTSPKPPKDPRLFTFVAYDEGRLVGTIGIRLDSVRGLSADERYKEETDALRSAGCKLCEYTRLALDHETISKPVLASLFHTATILAHEVRGYDHAIIEVHPRHAAFYRRALLFEQIGEERLNRRVNAPGVLLCLPFERVPLELEKFGGRPDLSKGTHMIYPYFFGRTEAEGIRRRLRELAVRE
jgi:hypothetical protein